jgi:hypothetical protein
MNASHLRMTNLMRGWGLRGLGAWRSFGPLGGIPSFVALSFPAPPLASLAGKEGGSGNFRIAVVSKTQPLARSSRLHRRKQILRNKSQTRTSAVGSEQNKDGNKEYGHAMIHIYLSEASNLPRTQLIASKHTLSLGSRRSWYKMVVNWLFTSGLSARISILVSEDTHVQWKILNSHLLRGLRKNSPSRTLARERM